MEIIRKISRWQKQEFLQFLSPENPQVNSMGILGIEPERLASDAQAASCFQKVVRTYLISFVRGQPLQDQAKKVWEEHLPIPHPDVQALLEVAARTLPWWGSLSHCPGFSAVVETHLLGSIVRQWAKEQVTIRDLEKQNLAWQACRPAQYDFALKLASKVCGQLYRGTGPNLQQYLQQLYLGAYRQIDTHLTGTGLPADFTGPVQILEHSRHSLSAAQSDALRQKKFIPLQPLPIGTCQGDTELDSLAGHLMLDSFQTQGGLNHNHFVFSFAKHTAPLTAIPTYRLKHKGIESASLVDYIHDVDWQERHWAYETGSNIAPRPPEGMKSVLPSEWFFSHRILPCTLSALGIYSYWTPTFQEAVLQVRRQCPTFAQEVAGYVFNPEIVLWFLIRPVVVRHILAEIDHLNSDLHGSARDLSEQLSWIVKNQDEAFRWLKDRYNIIDQPPVRRTVQSAPSTNWCGHGNWYLLPEHIREMEKDGMVRRTIKMSGVYSVVENSIKEEVLSRQGRSKVRHRVEELGNLLVYPNPLIGHERHSKTEFGQPKYLAPEESISPPMLVPVQAKFTPHNKSYLTSISPPDFVRTRGQALDELRRYEQKVDLSNYTQHLLRLGHATEHAAHLAALVLRHSTVSALYDALTDGSADIEVTEGQKKTYVMYQSYKDLIETEDFHFLSSLPAGKPIKEYEALLQSLPRRANKLFVCSPGVWQPLKSWKKFSPEGKKFILDTFSLDTPPDTPVSPLNERNKYCLTPPWAGILNYQNRKIIITYDQDADQNPGVALSVSALAQCFLDISPSSQVDYRLITPRAGISAKGADDFIVAHGNQAFWDGLEVSTVAANISHGELVSQPHASYIGYLIEKARQHIKTLA
jgi:hypothetical protein